MIEIVKYRAGICNSCNEKPGEYSIRAGQGEWDGPTHLCQVCMISVSENNQPIRGVLLIQSATSE